MIRFKLGAEDAAKYKGGAEWFVYDTAKIRAMTARQVIELESHLGSGLSIAQAEVEFYGRASLAGLLDLLYLARRLSGVVEAWENFDPHLHEVVVERFDPAAEAMPSSGDLSQIEVRTEPADEASIPPTSPAA